MIPKIRPHQLEKAVSLSVEYCKSADFHRKLLEKSNKCPVLMYQLYKRGVFVFEDIEPFLSNRNTFILCYYFRKESNDFESFIRGKNKPRCVELSFFENISDIDLMIEYGYLPSSIEYHLKYDVIDSFINMYDLTQKAEWSPFEWSIKARVS